MSVLIWDDSKSVQLPPSASSSARLIIDWCEPETKVVMSLTYQCNPLRIAPRTNQSLDEAFYEPEIESTRRTLYNKVNTQFVQAEKPLQA